MRVLRPACLLLAVVAAVMGYAWAGDLEDFDPRNPPLLEVGKKYRLVIHPGKKARPVTLIFQAGDEGLGDQDGSKRKKILSQEDYGTLSFDLDGTVPTVDIVDYDRDGYLDFRVVAGWGTGGTWYNYYRFNGKKYVPWLEPQRLGINSIRPEESLAVSSWRCGPCWSASYYRMRGASFILVKKERYDQASYLRRLVPCSVPDSNYVLITETISKNRIIHRNIKLSNPWEDDRMGKVILDRDVDESLSKKTK